MELQESRPYIPAFEKNAFLKAYKCSFCNRIYSTQVHGSMISGRIPLLMPCSHTICEECLLHMTKTKNISCKVCQYEMILEKVEAIDSFFPVDYFLFGSLMNLNSDALKRSKVFWEKKIQVLPLTPAGAVIKHVKKPKKGRRTEGCTEGAPSETDVVLCSQQGCTKRAEFRCISCSELYCTKCDKKIHESIRILRNHIRYPIDVADMAGFNLSCLAHPDSVGEYSCITCNSMLCSKCVIKDHTGHEIISVEDKNAQELDSFKDTLKKGKILLKSMEITQKKVKLEINASRLNHKPNNLEYDIIKHFSTLHSRLQLLEQSMLDQFSKAQAAKVDSLHRISTELSSNISIMHALVSTGNMIIEGGKQHLDKLVLSELEKNITDNLILPCELVEENSKKEDAIQFIADDSFIDTLQNHCRIEYEEGLSFKLAAMTDFTKKDDLPSDEESACSTGSESIRSLNESESSAASHISSSKLGTKTRISIASRNVGVFYGESRKQEKPNNSKEPFTFVKNSIETVSITHLTNPSDFYVQLARKRKQIEELSKKYELYAEHSITPTEPEIGSMYIVQFTTEKNSKWYRARVKDVHTTGITILYEVFYIDYGNSAVVPVSKIRTMKPIFMQDEPFAYKCSLFGIISQKNEWTDNVLKYMVDFITGSKNSSMDSLQLDNFLINENSNCNLKMHIYDINKGVLNVDLQSNNQSLSDALIFMGYAQPVEHLFDTSKKRKKIITETKIASAMDNYRKDIIYQIIVSNVISPYCIFIQLWDNRKIIENLQTAMTRYYNKKDSRAMVYIPEKGMVYVAKLSSSNNNWWRVEVIDLPGGANVEVFALDYGITEVIPWNQLSKIRDIHKQTDAQAIQVSLSDIVPPNNDEEWSAETNEFLREYLKNKNLSMLVNETSKTKLMVTLYEQTDETDICIDALLVRKDLAKSTGESSLLVEFHKILPGESETKKRSFNQLMKDVKPLKSEDQSKSMMCGKNFIVEVKFLQITSPGSFYVDIPEWYDEKAKMFQQMTQFYSEQISPAKKWELDEKCVVRSIKDEKYYRAIITKVLEDDCYEVFLKDLVRTEEVPSTNLFELNETFATHDYTLHCRLGGMKPTGGLEKWSGKSIEIFQDFVDQYSHLYISKYGPIVDKVLSVQLVASWEENAGPLEPSKSHTVVLNEILLEEGVVFPVKVASDEPIIKGTISPTSLSGLNIIPSVSNFHSIINGELTNSLTPISKFFEGESLLKTEYIPSSTTKPTSWLPPVEFTEKQFKAWTSYVDFEGSVYIQTAKAKNLLQNVCRILENHFKDSKPDPPHTWEIGQMCTILYHEDQTFCRGLILDITGDKMKVNLVDYGNSEIVSHDELRSEILATDIPISCVKCKLANVIPKTEDEKWPVSLLDRLHLTLVYEECEVIINNYDDEYEDLPHVLIYMKNECINNLCNTAEWQKKPKKTLHKPPESDDDKSVVIEEDICPEEDISVKENICIEKFVNSSLKYNYVQLPNDKKSFKACVINVIDYRSIVIEADFASDVINETKDEFAIMSNEIATYGSEQPLVSYPSVGMACIALFGEDEKWYRAEVLDVMDIHGREIKVFFIDYGNVEIVPREDVRLIKQEWLTLPVSMFKIKIWGIIKVPDYDNIEVTAAMKEAVINKKVICQVQQYLPEVEVKLIDEESFDLVYKRLLDENLIQSVA